MKKPLRPDYDREVFAALRAVRGMTHAEIARRSFLSPSTIAKLRKGPRAGGTRFPQAATLRELMRVGGYRMEWIKDDSPQATARRAAAEGLAMH